MDRNTLRKIIEDRLANLEGAAFQDVCDRLALELYPGDFQPVRPGGTHGDMKNDGYCPTLRIFFAAHATRGETAAKTKNKISSDLEGCLAKHRDVKTWRFMTNDTLTGEVDAFVDNNLRPAHPDVAIEIWGHKRIADEICKLTDSRIEKITDLTFGSSPLEDAPVVDLIDVMNNGGPNGHFLQFAIKNVGSRTALDCRLYIIGDDGYEWASNHYFRPQNLDPQRTRTDIELHLEPEKVFKEEVPNLRLLIEYEDATGSTIFSGRDLVQELAPSGEFFKLKRGSGFTPPTIVKPHAGLPPIRLERDRTQRRQPGYRILSDGVQLWNYVANSHQYRFGHPGDCTEDELDVLTPIFDEIKDWGEIAGDLISLTQVRDAQRSLSGLIAQVEQAGFVLVGKRDALLLTGGVGKPSRWNEIEILATRKSELVRDWQVGPLVDPNEGS
jgi:hypothetical protein